MRNFNDDNLYDNPLIPPPPYIPLSPSDNDNNPVANKYPILTKKRILIGCLIGSSLAILSIISIKSVLSIKSSTIYDTTTTRTTTLNQSPTTSTETVSSSSSKSCPISAVNAAWNNSGIVFVNPLARCLSNETGLCDPRDLFIDDIHDTLYIADMGNNRIQKYLLNETYNSEVGATGITVASKDLILPQSVFVDIHTEDMYIMDFDQKVSYVPEKYVSGKLVPAKYASYRVHLWKKNDNVGRILFNESGVDVNGITDHCLTLDKQMNIYVGTRYYIKKWLVSTNYTEKVVVAGKNQNNSRQSTDLYDPVGFFITDDLTLYIADWENKRIQKWTVNATEGTTVIENLMYVVGLTMDCNGYLYFTDTNTEVIYQLNMVANQKRVIVRNEDNLKNLIYYWPLAIKIDRLGNLFVTGNNQLHKFSILHK
ncbi:unnamed protein product [Adineta steineri]|uniref:Uncharacterized protein n=1 Tax=Adineta steineri TaxID=433720 RepID=A0A816BVQ1_9BILA|nr:unnamed protein product [Adineta steineri]CAF1613470.1 unnamed protein product [Adineta steineri]